MTGDENFLTRWSRRKLERQDPDREAEQPAAQSPSVTPDEQAKPAEEAVPSNEAAPETEGEPAFDLSTLPSIESIGADTDIRNFLLPGVPAELKRAALRRAWSADPKIRDFIGIAENQWDFTAPDSMPGFGPLEMTDEVRRMIAEIVNPPSAEPSAAPTPQAAPLPEAQALAEPTAPSVEDENAETPAPVAHESDRIDVASQHETEDAAPAAKPRRGGGALPQ